MSVTATLHYRCGGCDASEDVEVKHLRSRFRGFNGKDHGLGVWENDVVDAVTHCPEGWMAYDPYTRCCYCPKCIADIWPDPEERRGLGVTLLAGDP